MEFLAFRNGSGMQFGPCGRYLPLYVPPHATPLKEALILIRILLAILGNPKIKKIMKISITPKLHVRLEQCSGGV